MNNEYDGFSDIVEAEEGGLFRGGVSKIDKITQRVTRDGAVLEFCCQGCGRPYAMTIDFAELVGMQFGMPPQAWIQNSSTWELKPDFDAVNNPTSGPTWRPTGLQCSCQFRNCFPIRLTPDEPKTWLNRALASGFVNQGQLQALTGQAVQHAQRLGLMAAPMQQPMMRR